MRARTLIGCLPLLLVMITLATLPAAGQQTEKRSDVEFLPVGPPPEEATPRLWGAYSFSTTVEFGWLFTDIGGNVDTFRSHVNQIHDGPRAFDFSLRAKGTPGAFFSDFYVEGAGWGGDPSNWLRYGASKERWFDFRAT